MLLIILFIYNYNKKMENNSEGILITNKEPKKNKKHIVFDEKTI